MTRDTRKTRLKALTAAFGDHLQEHVQLANYTTAHVGGPADGLLIANSSAELETIIRKLWELGQVFTIIGSGSNLLVSDEGYPGVVVINRARTVKVDARSIQASVWAESGANLGGVARQVALRGLSGLEWAATIPGTIGGAVYGNAGAHGGDIKGSLLMAEILHPLTGKESWSCERLAYSYRSSILKRSHEGAVILAARLSLTQSNPADVQARMAENTARRHGTQPPGASMGSMFKNPEGDYAGRLIEAAGLKGTHIGGAEISALHANFFVNAANAKAADIWQLIELARQTVLEKFGVQLELEVELLGNWSRAESARDQNLS
jgi:UDP-N-acetylmuramate dehydrogenase